MSHSRRALSGLIFSPYPWLSGDVQVCVVTGGARGLGNEFCRAFVRSCVPCVIHHAPTQTH